MPAREAGPPPHRPPSHAHRTRCHAQASLLCVAALAAATCCHHRRREAYVLASALMLAGMRSIGVLWTLMCSGLVSYDHADRATAAIRCSGRTSQDPFAELGNCPPCPWVSRKFLSDAGNNVDRRAPSSLTSAQRTSAKDFHVTPPWGRTAACAARIRVSIA
jgi:hypothetical protein